MNCHFGIFLVLLISYHSCLAQNQDSVAIRKYYEENTLLWLGGNKYFKNSQSYPLKNLKNEIVLSPDAIYEETQYRRNNRKALIGKIVTIGLLISPLLAKNQNTQVKLIYSSIFTMSITISIGYNAQKHLSRAIWLHNRDVLLR